MLQVTRLFLLSILFLLLVGCQPSPSSYTYVPPVGNADKKCVAQCLQGKKSCQKICQFKQAACLERGGDSWISSCQHSCDCITSFNTCYTACGGQVIGGFF